MEAIEDMMNRINQLDFLVIKELDIENKLLVPTVELYAHLNLQFKVLYHDIRQALVDSHALLASAAKQFYVQPMETAMVWYTKTLELSETVQATIQMDLLPKVQMLYQGWELKLVGRPGAIGQSLQAFWDNPGDVTIATLDSVGQYALTLTGPTERALQALVDNPEQFMASILTPASEYLRWFGDELEALLISTYYLLLDLANLLMAQPSATVQALYSQTLSVLLETYSTAISALLAML